MIEEITVIDPGEVLEAQEWYVALIDECKAIITEAVFTSRWSLVEGYHQVGGRIRQDGDKEPITKLLQRVAVSLNTSERTLWYAVQFYDKFPDLNLLPLGKNATWKKVIALLPTPKPTVVRSSGHANIRLYKGDMLEVLPTLGKFDLVVTDPPYGVTDYAWDVLNTREWLKAIKPHLADKYNLFWFCSPVYQADIEMIFRELELPIQSRIVWHRRNMALGSAARNKFIDTWEMIFHAGNRELNFPAEWSDAWFDVQTFAVPQSNFTDQKLHPTQKPEGLIKRLVEFGSYSGDKILDPFAGSGTTGAVSPGDCECTLIEQEEEYIQIIESRLGVTNQGEKE